MTFIIAPFLLLACLLNAVQSFQFQTGLLHPERMSYDQYVHIFAKPGLPAYDNFRLLIDRSDTTWVEAVPGRNHPSQQIRTTVLFKLDKMLVSPGGVDVDLGKVVLLDKLSSDETMLEVIFEYAISDSTKSSLLRLETVSRYNAYDWQSKELALGAAQQVRQAARLKFNLPDIHHRKDQLQFYIDNDGGGPITIYAMKIVAKTLMRLKN